MNPLIEFLIALASIPRRVMKWGLAGTPAKMRRRRSPECDLMFLRPCMNIRKRMRLANQGRVYGWYGCPGGRAMAPKNWAIV